MIHGLFEFFVFLYFQFFYPVISPDFFAWLGFLLYFSLTRLFLPFELLVPHFLNPFPPVIQDVYCLYLNFVLSFIR